MKKAHIPERLHPPYYVTEKDVYGQESNHVINRLDPNLPIDETGKLHTVKSTQDFLDLPIGSYIVDCHFWYLPVNGAYPVTISRKIRQPSDKEMDGLCPLNDTLFLVAKFTPQKAI